MRKKITALVILVSMVSSLVVGCGSFRLHNEYITILKYKGLEITEPAAIEISDEQVDAEIASILDANSVTDEVTDRAVQTGDTVTMDYVGTLNGEAFDGGSQEGATLEIGSKSFIDGFEDALIGHKIGEVFDIDVTFPEDYQEETLAGQDVVFNITLHGIGVRKVPELTDEYVKTLSETAQTVDELKEEIRAQNEERAKESAEEELKTSVWAVLAEHIDIKQYPEDKVEETRVLIRTQQEEMAAAYGMEFAEMLEAMGMTEETFAQQVDESAKQSIVQEMAMNLIATKEKLVPTEEEYQTKFAEMATTYGYESVEALIEAATEETLKKMVIQEAVGNFLFENSVRVPAAEAAEDEGAATVE